MNKFRSVPKIINPLPCKRALNSPENTKMCRVVNQNEIQNRNTPECLPSSIFELRMMLEGYFEELMMNVMQMPINESIEPIMVRIFGLEKCICWVSDKKDGAIYSPTYHIIAPEKNSLPWFVYRSQCVFQIQKQNDAPNGFFLDPKIAGLNNPQLFFPVSFSGICYGVIQLVKYANSPCFNQTEIDIVSFFGKKFKTYGKALFSFYEPLSLAQSIAQSKKEISTLFQSYFYCNIAEIWQYDHVSNVFCVFGKSNQTMEEIPLSSNSIVYESLTSNLVVFGTPFTKYECLSTRETVSQTHSICVPYSQNQRESWAILLSGRNMQFGCYEEYIIRALIPYVIEAINSSSFNQDFQSLSKKLNLLLDFAEIMTQKKSINEVINMVQFNGPKFFMCESCRIVLCDKDSDSNSSDQCEVSGISGKVNQMKEILFFSNVKEISVFSPEIDAIDVKNPYSCIGVPIYNNQHISIASLLLWNPKGIGDNLEEEDTILINVFSSIIGSALSNAYYSKFLSQVVKKSTELVMESINCHSQDFVFQSLNSLLVQIMEISVSSRISVFASERDSSHLFLVTEVGKAPVFDSVFAETVVKNKEHLWINRESISLKLEMIESSHLLDLKSDDLIGVDGISLSRASSVFSYERKKKIEECGLLEIPIKSIGNINIGVIEVFFLKETIPEDTIKFLKEFAKTLSVIFNALKYPEMAPLGFYPIEMSHWLTEEEFSTTLTPSLMRLKDPLRTDFLFPGFDYHEYDGLYYYKFLFRVFEKFGIQSNFGISNEKLLSFFSVFSHMGNEMPSQSWSNAVGIIVGVCSILANAKLDRILAKTDILTLILSSFILGVDTKSYDDHSCELQIEMLSKKCSFNRWICCVQCLEYFTGDKTNVFCGMSPLLSKSIWKTVIDIVVSTDPLKILELISFINESINDDSFDYENSQPHRIALLKLLLVAGKYSDLCRTYNTFILSAGYLCDEIIRKIDINKMDELVFSGVNKNRKYIDKLKSIPIIVSHIILPIMTLGARLFTPFKIMLTNIRNNLSEWTKDEKNK